MKFIVIGDIVGNAGKKAVEMLLNSLKEKYKPQLTIANGENIARGRGITHSDYKWLLNQGIDVITLGNHAFDHRDIYSFIDQAKVMVRPLNLSEDTPGKGIHFIKVNQHEIAVINILGQAFMKNDISPFKILEEQLLAIKKRTSNIIIDFHAESTSEKQAMAHWLDGQVSFVYGTHTHVQTNDLRILTNGTGYISDIGMTGAVDSIIGFNKEDVIQRFTTKPKQRLSVEENGQVMLNGIFFEINPMTNQTISAQTIHLTY
ncbi:TIGR00282 family metallophosphoesterase [Aerococcaceae bacterium DSM 111020]|nr:TIGR00282 family metallophosphoesterase [Aerococcaceae bacterium DSM 111020]